MSKPKEQGYCYCGRLLHDGCCYEVNAVSEDDAEVWLILFEMTPEERKDLLGASITRPPI